MATRDDGPADATWGDQDRPDDGQQEGRSTLGKVQDWTKQQGDTWTMLKSLVAIATDNDFVAKEPCSNKVVKIKRCAVIKLRNDKAQHYCRGAGKPTYFEEVDVVEYWTTSKPN